MKESYAVFAGETLQLLKMKTPWLTSLEDAQQRYSNICRLNRACGLLPGDRWRYIVLVTLTAEQPDLF